LGDGEYHIVVIPASKLVDFHELRPALGLTQARLATEDEIARLFPDCELAAMPPFGSLYGIPVYLDASLAGEPVIAMPTAEFRRLADPVVVSLVREPALHHW